MCEGYSAKMSICSCQHTLPYRNQPFRKAYVMAMNSFFTFIVTVSQIMTLGLSASYTNHTISFQSQKLENTQAGKAQNASKPSKGKRKDTKKVAGNDGKKKTDDNEENLKQKQNLPASEKQAVPLTDSPSLDEAAAIIQKQWQTQQQTQRQMQRSMIGDALYGLAMESQNFKDKLLGIRTQARVADLLWDIEKDQARALFRRAWDNLDSVDEAARDTTTREESERLRNEIVRLAARREASLGEEFIAKLSEEAEAKLESSTIENPAAGNARHPTAPLPEGQSRRLEVADYLLSAGVVEQAMKIASPALQSVNMHVVSFLSDLRQKNPSEADQRYIFLLKQALSDPLSDANTVSILASYILSPHIMVLGFKDGTTSTGQLRTPTPSPESHELRTAFLQTARQILLRPLLPSEQDRTSAGRPGTYFIISRLLPFFEKHDTETALALRGYLSSLYADVPDGIRRASQNLLSKSMDQAKSERQEPIEIPGQINLLTDPAEKEKSYVTAALSAASSGDELAREWADKVSNEETRRSLRMFVDCQLIRNAITKKKADLALRLTRTGQINNFQRVWGYAEVTRLLSAEGKDKDKEAQKESDRLKVESLLNEALNEAVQVKENDPQRAYAFVGVASQFWEIDKERAWTIIDGIANLTGNLPNFSGNGGGVSITLKTRSNHSIVKYEVPYFNFSHVFSLFARNDLSRALATSRRIQGDGARVTAILTIARSVISDAKLQPK